MDHFSLRKQKGNNLACLTVSDTDGEVFTYDLTK